MQSTTEHTCRDSDPCLPVVVPVQFVRVITLSGHANFSDGTFHVTRAVGVIEVVGVSAEGRAAVLKIGFSKEQPFPSSTLVETEKEITGTLKLPSRLFGAYALDAHSPNAHIRLGAGGEGNALASDQSLLR